MLAQDGEARQGIAQSLQSSMADRAAGAGLIVPTEALLRAGNTREQWYEPECYRLKTRCCCTRLQSPEGHAATSTAPSNSVRV
jgi:hypothetical protein